MGTAIVLVLLVAAIIGIVHSLTKDRKKPGGAAAAAAVAAPAVPVTAPTEDVHNGMNQKSYASDTPKCSYRLEYTPLLFLVIRTYPPCRKRHGGYAFLEAGDISAFLWGK